MQKPSALLAEIIALAKNVLNVLEENEPHSQQKTLIQHIHNTAQQLHVIAVDIPPTEYAMQAIIPVLGDTFAKPQSAIFGYAKLLLEPDANTESPFTPEQQQHLTAIYEKGMALWQLTQTLSQNVAEERKTLRTAPPIIFDLNMVIWQNIPVYRYWLRDTAVRVTAEFSSGLPPVYCNPYHIVAIAQHIVITLGKELIEYGKIRISGVLLAEKYLRLTFFCTGIELNRTQQDILFQQQGRHIYRKRIAEQNALLHFSHEQGVGANIHLDLPLPPRTTTSQSDFVG